MLRAVRPGGALVIVDEYAPTLEDERIALADIYARRPLEDGHTFTIVKVFYDLPICTPAWPTRTLTSRPTSSTTGSFC